MKVIHEKSAISRTLSPDQQGTRLLFALCMALAMVIASSGISHAVSSYATSFKSTYPSSPLSSLSTVSGQPGNLCTVCHGPSGGSRNAYGQAFANAGRNFKNIESQDSDGDTFSNIIEINAGTFPGNAASKPAGDTTAPTVTAFSIPSTSTSLTVSITTFTASDNVGVTGYLLTETSAKPAAGAGGWSGTKPASYTFASQGTKTLYAWAKDAAGNVSNSLSASVTITIPAGDTTAPTVTAFSLPATATSLTVTVTAFSATDNVGVTGYLLTETSAKPAAGAGGWSGTAPTSYTFASQGTKTLYAWAKDAAGNVSNSLSASVTITLTTDDTTPPMITSFEVPAVSSTLKVPIASFTASDNIGVTGYMVKKNAAVPSASDGGWMASPPAFAKFNSEGVHTVYAWTKDAAGNISAAASSTVKIKLNVGTAIIPVPASQEVFSSSAIAYPAEKGNLAKAKPLGIGPLAAGGPVLDLQASIGPFDGPVDIYITLFAPAQSGSLQPSDTFYLRPDNVFTAVTTVPGAWQKGVTDVNEHITSINTADLLPGPYILIMTVTPAGSQDTFYHWVTPFIIP